MINNRQSLGGTAGSAAGLHPEPLPLTAWGALGEPWGPPHEASPGTRAGPPAPLAGGGALLGPQSPDRSVIFVPHSRRSVLNIYQVPLLTLVSPGSFLPSHASSSPCETPSLHLPSTPRGGPPLHPPPLCYCPQIHGCDPHQPLSWVTDVALNTAVSFITTASPRSSGYSAAPLSPSKGPHWGSQASHNLGPPRPMPSPSHSAPATPASLLFFKPTSYVSAQGLCTAGPTARNALSLDSHRAVFLIILPPGVKRHLREADSDALFQTVSFP